MIPAFCKFIRNSHQLWCKFCTAITLVLIGLGSNTQVVLAQVCTNPAGEIVLNQTFGTVGNAVSLDGLTIYGNAQSNCPDDSKYALVPSLDGTCFNSTWYAVPMDHTPNDRVGNMLIVNGGNTPGTFYQQPIGGLCRGTSYEVSVWAMNVLRTQTCIDPLVPNLSVVIETPTGQVIQSAALGLIQQADAPTWRRYAVTFTMPTSTDNVVIKLVNNQGDYGCGNDLAIDDFQVKQCSECEQDFTPIYVPNAFTPNQDGINDKLTLLISTKPNSFSLKIYNRWGSLVFWSTDPAQQWDGTYAGRGCESDTYAWVVSYQTGARTKREHTQSGQVFLVR